MSDAAGTLTDELRAQLDETVAAHSVVVFMKGDRAGPQCGFSASVVETLDAYLRDYYTVDVLADLEVREGVKVYSDWPTIPQIYVRGEFLGGADILTEMETSGELATTLGDLVDVPAIPEVTITDAGAEAFRGALADTGDDVLRLAIDGRFYNELAIGEPEEGDIIIESNGLKIHFDRRSARRAHGLRIDFVDQGGETGFKIDNPNAPPMVKDMPVKELAEKLKSGEEFLLVDVRTPREADVAKIEGAHLLDPELEAKLENLDKDTTLVFHCHHGGRSMRAAQHFLRKGFTDVYNVPGGIDAWSQEVDPSVARY